MNVKKRIFHNQRGMSLAELMISIGLTTIVLGMTIGPMVQMKKMDQRVSFQTGVDQSQLVVLQEARNSSWVKVKIKEATGGDLTISGSPIDRCFSGYGNGGCAAFTVVDVVVDNITFNATSGIGTTTNSRVTLNVACGGNSCTSVTLDVETAPVAGPLGAGSDGRPVRRLVQQISYAPKSLSTRPEIDFGGCAGKVVTGIDFVTLKAECLPISGNSTCEGVGTGPMSVFGQPFGPGTCQEGANATCPVGAQQVGLINGQVQCAPLLSCLDPFSTSCVAPPPPPPCVEDWTPAVNTVCAGAAFVQTALNCGPPNPTQAAVGTMVCNGPCTKNGTISWNQVAPASCENALVAAADVPPASRIINNLKLGSKGTFTMQCIDNTGVPAPNAYDMAGAIRLCAPVTCAVPSEIEWSNAGVKSAVAGAGYDAVGPWPCKGSVVLTQTGGGTPGNLFAKQLDSTAVAKATNSAPTASTGQVTAVCNDPGPATDTGRTGVWEITGASCDSLDCGTAKNQTFVTEPTVDLCTDSSTPTVTFTALEWSWQCGAETCKATRGSPLCGVANGKFLPAIPVTPDICADASSPAITISALPVPFSGSQWDWWCGSNQCHANELVCGTASGMTVATPPSSNFCNDSAITPAVTPVGLDFTWTCGSSACTAYGVAGACSLAAGKYTDAAPVADLCDDGSTPPTTSSPSGWTWDCGATSCSSNKLACGTAAAVSSTTAPSSNLCNDAAYVVGAVTASGGGWGWQCGSTACGPTPGCWEWKTMAYVGAGSNDSALCDGGVGGHGTGTAIGTCDAATNNGTTIKCCDSGADCYSLKCQAAADGTCPPEVICGSADGGSFADTLFANKCSDGSSPAVDTSDPIKFKWTCGLRACEATVNNGCGTAQTAGVPLAVAPVAPNLCTNAALTPTVTTLTDKFTWNCGTVRCEIGRAPSGCTWQTTSPPNWNPNVNYATEGNPPPGMNIPGFGYEPNTDYLDVQVGKPQLCDATTVGETQTSLVSGGPYTGQWTATCLCTSPPLIGCNSATDGQQLSAKPTANLCTAGAFALVTETGSPGSYVWSWICGSDTCSATQAPNCGSASTNVSGLKATAKPTDNLCNDGTKPPVSPASGPGPWTWNCGSNLCTAEVDSSCTPKTPSNFFAGTWDGHPLNITNFYFTSAGKDFYDYTTAPAPPDAYSAIGAWDSATCSWSCCKMCKYADLHECYACDGMAPSPAVCSENPRVCPTGYHPNGNACAADGGTCSRPNPGLSWLTDLPNGAPVDDSTPLADAQANGACFWQAPASPTQYPEGTVLSISGMSDLNLGTGGGNVRCSGGTWFAQGTLSCGDVQCHPRNWEVWVIDHCEIVSMPADNVPIGWQQFINQCGGGPLRIECVPKSALYPDGWKIQ